MGDSLLVTMSDGVKFVGYPTGGNLWLVRGNGGTGPVDPPDPTTGITNPWDVGRGDPPDGWESHASYSAGGYDWSGAGFELGAPIIAPAAGTLHTSGGSGEYAVGNVGSAGLRSILYLDVPVNRTVAKSGTLMNGSTREADGPMAAIVLQHQNSLAPEGHYNKGDTIGYVGRTGNDVLHLHVHGLDSAGQRVDFIKFV